MSTKGRPGRPKSKEPRKPYTVMVLPAELELFTRAAELEQRTISRWLVLAATRQANFNLVSESSRKRTGLG